MSWCRIPDLGREHRASAAVQARELPLAEGILAELSAVVGEPSLRLVRDDDGFSVVYGAGVPLEGCGSTYALGAVGLAVIVCDSSYGTALTRSILPPSALQGPADRMPGLHQLVDQAIFAWTDAVIAEDRASSSDPAPSPEPHCASTPAS